MLQTLAAMLPYIPPGLARALLADPTLTPLVEQFPAAVLFADISSFTPLTETLAQRGTEGPAVGVATGPVFAGPVGSTDWREYTVVGDAVNSAARLMAAAGPGAIRCDFATARTRAHELDVHFVKTLPVPAALCHSRESGHPGDEHYGDWMPACAGMTCYWRRTYETDI
jgi:class 3 adenylate cyclase